MELRKVSPKPKTKKLILILLSMTFLVAFSACQIKRYTVKFPTISPDGNKVLATVCEKGKKKGCFVVIHDLVSKKNRVVQKKDGFTFRYPRFSPDQKKIVFSVRSLGTYDARIAVMDIRADAYREITNGLGFDGAPSFSEDGNAIIFVRAASSPDDRTGPAKKARQVVTEIDVYEIPSIGGRERRRTNQGFFEISPPIYVPGTKDFVFSAGSPLLKTGNEEKVKEMYGSNSIFRIGGQEKYDTPLLKNGVSSFYPFVSVDGKISFLSITNEMDGISGSNNYDVFLWDNGEIRRLTSDRSNITHAAISPDGQRVIYLKEQWRSDHKEVVIIDLEGNIIDKIDLF
jgi:Tol biopolymer transport system component